MDHQLPSFVSDIVDGVADRHSIPPDGRAVLLASAETAFLVATAVRQRRSVRGRRLGERGPEEAAALALIRDHAGLEPMFRTETHAQVAKRLTEAGLTRAGGRPWTTNAVCRLTARLRREVSQ